MNVASLHNVCLHAIIQYLVQNHNVDTPSNVHLQLANVEQFYLTAILKELVRCYPEIVNDQLLEALCQGNISSLSLRACVNVTAKGLHCTVQKCKQMKSMDLSECNQLVGEELLDVLMTCQHLTTLKLNDCCQLTPELLKAIMELPSIDTVSCENCRQLHRFPLDGFGVTAFMTPHLVSINVSGCHNITNTFVRHLTALHGPSLKSVNISWTNIDCTALVYLAGYTLMKVADVATQSFGDSTTYDTTITNLFRERNLLELCLANLENKKPIEKSASTYLRNMCAYCSQEIGVRSSSNSTISCFAESYEDYDIIESQVVDILRSDTDLGRSCADAAIDLELEWDILSVNDIDLVTRKQSVCTCSSARGFEGKTPETRGFEGKSPERKRSATFPLLNSSEEGISDNLQNGKGKQLYTPVLSSLDIARIDFYNYQVGTKYLEVFLKANETLEKLYMSWGELDDDVLTMIAQSQPNLQLLSLVDCERVTDTGINTLAKHSTHLKVVDMKGMPFVWDASLLTLVHANFHLQYLSMAESSLTDSVLFKIADCLSATLRHLDLSWCDNVSDAGVIRIVRSCEHLVYLDLRQCNVTSNTVREITNYGHQLTMLGLCGIQGLNDSVCIPLVKALRNLRVVDLSWNSSLTDETLINLFQSCSYVQEVTVAGLKRISSKPFLPIIAGLLKWSEVRCVIRHRMHLKYYSSTGRLKDMTEQEISDPAFYIPFRSVHYAPELRKLTLGYCDKVNDNHLAEIVAVCRGTLIIEDYYGEIIKPTWRDK